MSDDILFPSLVKDLKTLVQGRLVLEARQITPAEFRTGISDRAAAAQTYLAIVRKHLTSPIGDPAVAVAHLDRLEAIVRSMR